MTTTTPQPGPTGAPLTPQQVYITEPPSGSPLPLLQGRFAREHGTFALLVRPAEKVRGKRTRKTVSVPFFHALGKDLSTVGAYTNQTSEFREQIAHWFTAYDARELVVFDAHALYPATMRAIFEYGATVPNIGRLKTEVARGRGDGEILLWINDNATIKRPPWEIAQWSAWRDAATPGEVETREFFNGIHKEIGLLRDDVVTWNDLLDLDDYVSFGGKA